MARNTEKASTMLNRWLAQERQIGEFDNLKNRKNHLKADEIHSLEEAKEQRSRTIRDIRHYISEIQSTTLDEYNIKQLNDKINMLLIILWRLDNRLIELGGNPDMLPDSIKFKNNIKPHYQYFGQARHIPGVAEWLKQIENYAPDIQLEKTAFLNNNASYSYYAVNREFPKLNPLLQEYIPNNILNDVNEKFEIGIVPYTGQDISDLTNEFYNNVNTFRPASVESIEPSGLQFIDLVPDSDTESSNSDFIIPTVEPPKQICTEELELLKDNILININRQ